MLVPCDGIVGLSDKSCSWRDLRVARSYLVRCDLVLVISEEDHSVKLQCEYDAELFSARTIRRMLDSLCVLMGSIIAAPEQEISALPMLTPAERHEFLVERDATAAYRWHDQTLHGLFEAQVARTPDAIALTFDEKRISYAELNAQSNQLAHGLIAQGVVSGQSVALMLPKSPLQIAALLAVLKAGCSFVCLDPDYPTERLRLILDEVQPPLLVADKNALAQHVSLAQQLEVATTCRVLPMDLSCNTLAGLETQPQTNLSIAVTPDARAYIVYTSGSTGRPKGIMQSHSGFAQFTAWFGMYFEFGSGSRIAQWASITYDASYCEIFGALCFGATLCLAPPDTRYDPTLLVRWIAREALSVLQVVPSFAKQILRVIEDSDSSDNPFPNLSHLLLAGEVLSPTFARAWLCCFPDHPKLFNLYGPTECVLATYYPVESVQLEQPTIPIGHAIDGRQILILDHLGQLCSIGVVGEIYVRSRFLTDGYLQRPAETAAAFLQSPLHDDFPDPAYRTHDLGRWLPNGEVEFIGRADNLVKLRGIRVELEEIEAVLSTHDAVRECAVILHDSGGVADIVGESTPRLIGYIVLRRQLSTNPIIKDLKAYLLSHLPEYMVPATFVFLGKLPLTPNGKVDRKALPAPALTSRREEYIAPGTPSEQILADIWAEVLGLDRVGIHDNFFELGGHSLLATRIISRVRKMAQIELPLRTLFEAPTVYDVAQWAEQERLRGHHLTPIDHAPRDSDIPLSFAQQRLWFLDQLLPNNPAYNIPAFMRLRGPLNIAALERSLDEIVRRHEALRTTFDVVQEQPVQVIAPSLSLTIPVADLTHIPLHERDTAARRYAEQELVRCFDLVSGPLVRASMVQLSDTEHILLLVMHHIVSDEWSIGIFLKELAALYEAFSLDLSSPLPELAIQYADFSYWQRQWLSGDVLEQQLSYWKTQLENSPAVLDLPFDHPRMAGQQLRGATHVFALPTALTASIRALSRQENATLFMTLLAAFATLLYRYTSQDDIVVGSPIANRNRSEVEPLIGFFVNTLVLRTRLSGDMAFRHFLEQVRETCLSAYAHQDLPFEKLVAELRPERSSSHTPLFQVLFVLQNAPRGQLELPSVAVSPYTVNASTAKFDLNLYFHETGDRLTGALEYNADLFEATTAEHIVVRLQRLLEEITINPDAPLTSYSAPASADAADGAGKVGKEHVN